MEASGAGVEGAEGGLVEEEAAMHGARTAGSVGLLGPRLCTGCGGQGGTRPLSALTWTTAVVPPLCFALGCVVLLLQIRRVPQAIQ